MFTRPSFLIRQAAFILFLSTVSFFMPVPGAEVHCWAQAPSPDQKTDQADIKPEQQALPPSLVLPPSTSQAAPGESGRNSAGPAAGINGAAPGSPQNGQSPTQVRPDQPSMGGPPQSAVPHAPQPLQSPVMPPGLGQSPAVQPSSPPGQSPPAVQSRAVPLPRRGQVTLNFDDADVYTVIQTIFGETLRVNYVVDPRVSWKSYFQGSCTRSHGKGAALDGSHPEAQRHRGFRGSWPLPDCPHW